MTAPKAGRPAANPFAGIPCARCGYPALILDMRGELRLTARKLGSHSLAGQQSKLSAVGEMVQWPWCVCRNCGAECRGKE